MILDSLPPGITGFRDRSERPRALEPEAFKVACHLVAGMEGGCVESLDFDLLARSYYTATVRTRTDQASILCNAIYPYLAFVPPGRIGFTDLEFVAPVSLASVFASLTEFQPLDADWLSDDPTPELLANLADADVEQVKHWKPQRIGEIIFNYWD